MNLLKTIIERLNQRVEVANIFDKQFNLCELNANGNDKAWVHYIGNGQAEVVTNFDAKNGTLFWAKRGKVSVAKTDAYKMSGCKQLYVTTFPLTAYAIVRKSHLPCDAEDAQDWLASRVYKLTSGTDPLFKQSIGVINYEVVPSGYTNEIKTLTAHYEWACVSVDMDVQVITTSEDGCYDTCATGDIPLPDLQPCVPCLTEVAVDGVTIIGNGTAGDPLSAIGAGGGAIVVQDEGDEVTPVATTLNFTGAGVTASLTSPGVVEVNVPGGGSGGVGTLQEVTDLGNSTTNDIDFIANAGLSFDNGAFFRKGTTDAGNGGAKGTAQICSISYELKWEAGRLYYMEQDGFTIRDVTHNFAIVPQPTDDSTKGFVVGSRWSLDDGTVYLCSDATIGAAVWAVVSTGGVTNVTATSPLSSSGGTTPDISIQPANSFDDGYLTSADWNTFDGKFDVPTGTSADYLDGTGAPTPFPTIPTGTVTSVDLSMPAAFSVTGNPVTTSGTLAVTAAGVATQYIRGDGQLANFPTSSGGGASVSYYLNGSVSQGTFGGIAMREINKVPVIGGGTDFTINADGYIQSFITDANDPNQLAIPAGNWNFENYFSASSSGGTPRFYIELYKWDGATLTLIASNSTNPENITGGTAIDLYLTALAVPQTTLAATDRLAVRFYVIHSGRTITMHTEDNHLSQIITTFSTGLTSLNGLTAQTQLLAVGTSGTDFAISSTTATHTFNLPTASASNRGALSTADWTTFNGKVATTRNIGTTAPLSGGGDLSADRTLAIAKATASVDGYLAASDFTTFAAKQNAITPAALTKVDDTNVTLTLGGTPSTALLQAASLTLGWTGTLADSRIASAATWNAKQNAITLTTTGTSGAATLTGATLNIPQYAAPIIYKSTADAGAFLSIVNTAVYTQLIAANTYTIGDILRVTYRARKTGTAGIQILRIYVNATADLAGTPLLVGQYRGSAVNTVFQMQRHLAIKSSTVNTEVFSTATTGASQDFAQDVPSTIVIDWTATKYFVFALQNASALDTNYGSMFLIEKL